jgi:hypothetical protein
MSVEFRTTRLDFDPSKGHAQTLEGSVNFSNSVIRAGMAINGFKLKFTDQDRHLWEERINIQETNMKIADKNVSFPVSILLRDSSGSIDDRFEGWVDILVIAETRS